MNFNYRWPYTNSEHGSPATIFIPRIAQITMKTIKEVRQSFWQDHQQFASEYRKSRRQNDYPTDIRVSFVNYVDYLQRSGIISSKLANKVTL